MYGGEGKGRGCRASERLKRLTLHLSLDHGDLHSTRLLGGESKATGPKLGGDQRDVLRVKEWGKGEWGIVGGH